MTLFTLFIIYVIGFGGTLLLLGLSVGKVFPQTYTLSKLLLLSALWFYVWPYHFITKNVPFLGAK